MVKGLHSRYQSPSGAVFVRISLWFIHVMKSDMLGWVLAPYWIGNRGINASKISIGNKLAERPWLIRNLALGWPLSQLFFS
jgi:hypothetical protein